MEANDFVYGFRVVGGKDGERRATHWWRAFCAHAEADERAQCDTESYLSAFTFDEAFATSLRVRRRVKGLSLDVPCFGKWLWWDIDRENDLDAARTDTVRLVLALEDQFAIDADELLIFFSGAKGFHLGLATQLWRCEPCGDFHKMARAFCRSAATKAGVSIDAGIYDKVRIFRSPNSRHPKTGLHKIRVSYKELVETSAEVICQRAQRPYAFEVSEARACDWNLQNAWDAAAREVHTRAEAFSGTPNTTPKLNQLTLGFIRHGANPGGQGDDCETGNGRHRRLFSAAANLAEFGCPPALAHALLTEPGLDCGLPPSEVRRQIACGLRHARDGGA